jgi:hypothetical protein
MTTLIPFTPNNSSAPPFSTVAVLDGTTYNISVTWNIVGQRWYLQITDQSGNNLWMGAMVGSSLTYNIYLAPGIFSSSTILYRADTGNLELNP